VAGYPQGVSVSGIGAHRSRPGGEPGSGWDDRLPDGEVRLVVFFRALVPGRVKSRLAAELGSRTACGLYRAMLEDMAAHLAILLANMPRIQILPFADRRAPATLLFWPEAHIQNGATLADRMRNAFDLCFASGSGPVLLIGTDIPGLTWDVLLELLTSLSTNEGCIGPAADGGYYAIGFTRDGYRPEALTQAANAAGDETELFRTTSHLMSAAGARVHHGPALQDVDTLEDLDRALRSMEVGPPSSQTSHLWNFVTKFRILK